MNEHGFWVDRQGKVYRVGAYGHADFAREVLHSEGLPWKAINHIGDPEDVLLDRGWIRVSITGVWIITREIKQAQIDALWDLASYLNGKDDLMARRIMAAISAETSVYA